MCEGLYFLFVPTRACGLLQQGGCQDAPAIGQRAPGSVIRTRCRKQEDPVVTIRSGVQVLNTVAVGSGGSSCSELCIAVCSHVEQTTSSGRCKTRAYDRGHTRGLDCPDAILDVPGTLRITGRNQMKTARSRRVAVPTACSSKTRPGLYMSAVTLP